MTPAEIALVQSSFAKVVPIADDAAKLFYDRLFEIAPQVRALFPNDLADQRKKLVSALALVVAGLTNLPSIVPTVEALAVRHTAYGAKDEHYAVVGAALIWTLEKGLGAAFTTETRAAWLKAYTLLSGVMTAAAAKARAA